MVTYGVLEVHSHWPLFDLKLVSSLLILSCFHTGCMVAYGNVGTALTPTPLAGGLCASFFFNVSLVTVGTEAYGDLMHNH